MIHRVLPTVLTILTLLHGSLVSYLPIDRNIQSMPNVTAWLSAYYNTLSDAETDLPPYFNVYDELPIEKFVRNQGSANTCWAFAADSLLELYIAQKYDVYKDFSESHLIHNSPIPLTYQSGGYFLAAVMYYLNGLGPVDEDLVPYDSTDDTLSIAPEFSVTGYIEGHDNQTQIKELILSKGAVVTSIHYTPSLEGLYNWDTHSYYNPTTKLPKTHDIILVGWDDAYAKENFISQPSQNGAFIAQNSFGNGWGDDGIFYISYDDVYVSDTYYAIDDVVYADPSTRVYYYDETGVTHFDAYNNKNAATGVNVFESKDKENLTAGETEYLYAVGLYSEGNVQADIYFKQGTFDSENPVLGSIKKTVTLDTAGYSQIFLDHAIPLVAGEPFTVSVVFSGSTPFLVPIEAPYPGIAYDVWGKTGVGYIGDADSGDFVDITRFRENASIAVRAYTFER